jgi:tetratricopeptide (TPR) repeat protein
MHRSVLSILVITGLIGISSLSAPDLLAQGRDFQRSAELCMNPKEASSGIEACTRALRYKLSREENARLLNQRGLLNLEIGNDAEALRNYERALYWQPNFPQASYNRGSVKERMGDFSAAFVAYKVALALDPNYTPAQQALTRLNISELEPDSPGSQPTGWCQVWSNSNLVDQEQCNIVANCRPNVPCDTYYVWPTGNKTYILWSGTEPLNINGNPAQTSLINEDSCTLNTGSGNIFCYTEEPQISERNRISDQQALSADGITDDALSTCSQLLKNKTFEEAISLGCWRIQTLCFGSQAITTRIRTTEKRETCLQYLISFATGMGGDLPLDRKQAAIDLLANNYARSSLSAGDLWELRLAAEAVSGPKGASEPTEASVDTGPTSDEVQLLETCLRDASNYGYRRVYHQNAQCQSALDQCGKRLPQQAPPEFDNCRRYLRNWYQQDSFSIPNGFVRAIGE